MNLTPTLFKRVSAIAEVFAVLVAGNLIAAFVMRAFIPPAWLAVVFDPSENNALSSAFAETIRLLIRFGIMLTLGMGLLRWRFHMTPKTIGITRNNHSLLYLLGYGVVLFAISSLPWKTVVFLNFVLHFGQGLGGWDDIMSAPWSVGIVLLVLARAVVLPPLLEEPTVRGYFFHRLMRAYGPIGAMILTSVIFVLAHGHFYQRDPVVIAQMACALFSAACWAFATWKTGSLIPAIVAHALANSPEVPSAIFMGILLVIMAGIVVQYRSAIMYAMKTFRYEWKMDPHSKEIVGTAILVAALMGSAAVMRSLILIVGIGSVLIVLIDLAIDMRRTRTG